MVGSTTKIVIGRPRDGEVSTTAGTLAKKVNDITTAVGMGNFEFSAVKTGSRVAVVITY
jgi:hypothetical protein